MMLEEAAQLVRDFLGSRVQAARHATTSSRGPQPNDGRLDDDGDRDLGHLPMPDALDLCPG